MNSSTESRHRWNNNSNVLNDEMKMGMKQSLKKKAVPRGRDFRIIRKEHSIVLKGAKREMSLAVSNSLQ
jgi:hypothetical protein